MTDIRAVFFDAVGTLIHPDPPAPVVYAETARRFGGRLTATEIAPRFRAAFAHEEQRDRAENLRTNETREIERWQHIVSEVLPDVTDPAGCFAELFEHFGRPGGWRVEPGTETVLQDLSAQGFILGLASNYDHRLRPVAAALVPMLNRLVISSEVGWRKPAPQFFAALCESIDLSPERIVYVGDDRVNDYDGAQAAGLHAVLFDPLGKAGDGVRRIGRLDELLRGTFG